MNHWKPKGAIDKVMDLKFSTLEIKFDIKSNSNDEKIFDDFEELSNLYAPDTLIRKDKGNTLLKRYQEYSTGYSSFNKTYARILGFPKIYKPKFIVLVNRLLYKHFKTLKFLIKKDRFSLITICYILNLDLDMVIRYSSNNSGIVYPYAIKFSRDNDNLITHYKINNDMFNAF